MAKHFPGMGVVVHAGRKTHRQYRTPVLIFRRGRQFIIALTYGRESQWVQNVLAQGECELQTRGRTLRLASPHLFHDPQRRIMPAFVRAMLRLLNVSDFLEVTVVA
jgi:deazaflavin-dependent oxidoreductase (nitroreductase family)